jgi:acyl-CoA thioesterase-1
MKYGLNRLFRAQVCTALVLFNAIASLLGGAAAAAEAKTIRMIAFGDSLTAGYRLRPQDAFPAQLQEALRAKGYDVEVANAGVSGDTTAAGLERFDWAVPDHPDAVILELGANDALRGIDPAQARQNLEKILAKLKERGAEVLIAGILAPRNLGDDYVQRFEAIFPDLARKYGAVIHPFFLDGVVTRTSGHLSLNSALVLDDGMHPNAKGVAAIVASILPAVEELLGRVRAKQATKQTP